MALARREGRANSLMSSETARARTALYGKREWKGRDGLGSCSTLIVAEMGETDSLNDFSTIHAA
jgi:hypothetical protein